MEESDEEEEVDCACFLSFLEEKENKPFFSFSLSINTKQLAYKDKQHKTL